ncbi:unnamed protein product [Mytilus edulis]|uniref:Uncharacterized protein n=1 Tax=Mytilus edulis TaxID=6550 RepID=A0A8S3SKA4_MYTED|nr:unnamed protein product [Mytilus edulis]
MKFIALLLLPLVFGADPQPCCTRTKFTTSLVELGGYLDPVSNIPTPVDFTATVYYDYDNKMLRADRDMPLAADTMRRVTVITDFNKACNATYIATSKIGSASRSFSVNTWKIAMPNFFIKMSMTKDHCIPFSESTWGTVNKVVTEINYMFMDFKPSVPERIFDLPDACNGHQPGTGAGVGRRSVMKSMFLP